MYDPLPLNPGLELAIRQTMNPDQAGRSRLADMHFALSVLRWSRTLLFTQSQMQSCAAWF